MSADADRGREVIWESIINKSNAEVIENHEAMEWLRETGSDLNINAFALNLYHEDETLNTDLEEENYLTQQVVNRLSITRSTEEPNKIPLFLTSTQFEAASYSKCAQSFMKRLGVTPCMQDMWVLRNVVMNPFTTEKGFIKELMATLEETIIEEVDKTC